MYVTETLYPNRTNITPKNFLWTEIMGLKSDQREILNAHPHISKRTPTSSRCDGPTHMLGVLLEIWDLPLELPQIKTSKSHVR